MIEQDDFVFGSQSARMYEEFNCLRTDIRNKIGKKRVLVIDGNQIYHRK